MTTQVDHERYKWALVDDMLFSLDCCICSKAPVISTTDVSLGLRFCFECRKIYCFLCECPHRTGRSDA